MPPKKAKGGPSRPTKRKTRSLKQEIEERRAIFSGSGKHAMYTKAWLKEITSQNDFWRLLTRDGSNWEQRRKLTRKDYDPDYFPSESEESDKDVTHPPRRPKNPLTRIRSRRGRLHKPQSEKPQSEKPQSDKPEHDTSTQPVDVTKPRCAVCGKNGTTSVKVSLYQCHTYHLVCLNDRVKAASRDISLQKCAVPTCNSDLLDHFDRMVKEAKKQKQEQASLDSICPGCKKFKQEKTLLCGHRCCSICETQGRCPSCGFKFQYDFPPSSLESPKDEERKETSPATGTVDDTRTGQSEASVNTNEINPKDASPSFTSEGTPGDLEATSTPESESSSQTVPAYLKAMDYIFQVEDTQVPEQLQVTLIENKRPAKLVRPDPDEINQRLAIVGQKAESFNLSVDDARKMIYAGSKKDDGALLLDLENAINEYPHWSVLQTYGSLLERFRRLSTYENKTVKQPPPKQGFDSVLDKEICTYVEKVSIADSMILCGRLLKLQTYLHVHELIETQSQRKVGESIYDRFVEIEEATSGQTLSDLDRERARQRWKRIKGVGAKIYQFVQVFGHAILFVMPEFAGAEGFSHYSTGKCQILVHCLQNGPDANRLASFCNIANPVTSNLFVHHGEEKAECLATMRYILQYLAIELILPARLISSFIPFDPIREAIDLHPLPGGRASIASASGNITITLDNLRTLCYEEWLDDTVIQVVLQMYNDEIKPSRHVLDPLAFTFVDDKLCMSEDMSWVAKHGSMIAPIMMSYSEATNGNHWMLAIIDFERGCVEIADSLNSRRRCNTAARAIQAQVSKYSTISLRWESSESAPQENGFDCGIFLLLNAIWAMHGHLLPIDRPVDTEFTRRKFFREIVALIKGKEAKNSDGET